MNHIFVHTGGKFVKQFPKMSPLPEAVSENFKEVFYGFFKSKGEERGKLYIKIIESGSITFNDHVTGQSQTKELTSDIILEVPQKIFDFDFTPGKKYQITASKVSPL